VYSEPGAGLWVDRRTIAARVPRNCAIGLQAAEAAASSSVGGGILQMSAD